MAVEVRNSQRLFVRGAVDLRKEGENLEKRNDQRDLTWDKGGGRKERGRELKQYMQKCI